MSGCPMATGCRSAGRVRSLAPGVACLIFTAFSDDQVLLDSILAGAARYVLKQVRGSDLAVRGPHRRVRPVAAESPRGEQADSPTARRVRASTTR